MTGRTPAPGGPGRFVPLTDARPQDRPWPVLDWPVPRDVELRGHFVKLTPLDPVADAAELFGALDHDRVWRYLAGRPAGVAAYRAALLGREAAAGWQQWAVRGLTGEMLGTTAYLDVSPHDARLEIGSTAYTPSVWGTAVNPEVKLLLLTYAFEALRAGRVQLKTDVRNTRSQEAIARLGARYEGTLSRYQRRADGTVRDTVLFAIAAEDWPGVRQGLERRLAAFT